MGRIFAAAILLGGASVPGQDAPEGAAKEGMLFFFFSPDTATAPAAAKSVRALATTHAGKIKVRPVLVVENWRTFRKATEDSPLYRTVRALGDHRDPSGVSIPMFDEEGLRLAREWKLTRLPAFVLVARGKAHVLYGTKISIDELTECGR